MYLLKRTRNLFGVLLIFILICSILAGCTEAPDGGDNDTPQNGSEGDTPPEGETPDDSTQPPEEETSWKDKPLMGSNVEEETSPSFLVRFFIETSELDIGEDLPLKLEHLIINSDPLLPDFYPFTISKRVILREYNLESDSSVKTREQTVVEHDYNLASALDENLYFNLFSISDEMQIENIIVPSECFAHEKGSISFLVSLDYTIPSRPELEERLEEFNGVPLYYIKTGDTIKLFSSYYDFNNYGK
ncbi:MAG: hypothetical protein IJ459_05770 [Clostridia bacterium]|nr:hypothetical protein [Clostridia bacterium]